MGSCPDPLRAIFRCMRSNRAHLKDNYIISNFDQLGLQPELLRAVRDLHFTEPTPIQELAIPPALEGRDVLASAQTGSGKSACRWFTDS